MNGCYRTLATVQRNGRLPAFHRAISIDCQAQRLAQASHSYQTFHQLRLRVDSYIHHHTQPEGRRNITRDWCAGVEQEIEPRVHNLTVVHCTVGYTQRFRPGKAVSVPELIPGRRSRFEEKDAQLTSIHRWTHRWLYSLSLRAGYVTMTLRLRVSLTPGQPSLWIFYPISLQNGPSSFPNIRSSLFHQQPPLSALSWKADAQPQNLGFDSGPRLGIHNQD